MGWNRKSMDRAAPAVTKKPSQRKGAGTEDSAPKTKQEQQRKIGWCGALLVTEPTTEFTDRTHQRGRRLREWDLVGALGETEDREPDLTRSDEQKNNSILQR
jgi:hypothetical protein